MRIPPGYKPIPYKLNRNYQALDAPCIDHNAIEYAGPSLRCPADVTLVEAVFSMLLKDERMEILIYFQQMEDGSTVERHRIALEGELVGEFNMSAPYQTFRYFEALDLMKELIRKYPYDPLSGMTKN